MSSHTSFRYTAAAEALLEEDPDWTPPVAWRSEFRNVLAVLIRRGGLTFEWPGCPARSRGLLAGAEHEVDSDSVLALIRHSDCSAYDCEFVALARRLRVRLVTVDKKLLKAFPSAATALT